MRRVRQRGQTLKAWKALVCFKVRRDSGLGVLRVALSYLGKTLLN